ncbi:MAG TPA: protocatechuate 3,4-dioxygenase subunit alpha [Burkholderiales bacterium]|nr:protocatechuate 3,4-dioxygenase subunit alpha [Burkholderiales bacterium]
MKRAKLTPTGEATLGPFFPPRYVDEGANDLTRLEGRAAKGEVIEISGRVTQEDGAPLDNLVIEIWQADARGIYRDPADPRHAQADPDFLGWGRAATDKDGRYRFRTIRPGAPEGRAAHINFMIMYSGLMRILKTTLFFEASSDPVLSSVGKEREKLLIAASQGSKHFVFDIRLRGPGETPFFDD